MPASVSVPPTPLPPLLKNRGGTVGFVSRLAANTASRFKNRGFSFWGRVYSPLLVPTRKTVKKTAGVLPREGTEPVKSSRDPPPTASIFPSLLCEVEKEKEGGEMRSNLGPDVRQEDPLNLSI